MRGGGAGGAGEAASKGRVGVQPGRGKAVINDNVTRSINGGNRPTVLLGRYSLIYLPCTYDKTQQAAKVSPIELLVPPCVSGWLIQMINKYQQIFKETKRKIPVSPCPPLSRRRLRS